MLLLQPLNYDECKEHDLQSTFGVIMGLLRRLLEYYKEI